MDTVFMNSRNGKIYYRYRLLLSLSDKIDLKRSDKNICCFIESWHLLYMEKYKKFKQK